MHGLILVLGVNILILVLGSAKFGIWDCFWFLQTPIFNCAWFRFDTGRLLEGFSISVLWVATGLLFWMLLSIIGVAFVCEILVCWRNIVCDLGGERVTSWWWVADGERWECYSNILGRSLESVSLAILCSTISLQYL